jgi:acyl phosphate:glycerol-3-phosphate acyltransferase
MLLAIISVVMAYFIGSISASWLVGFLIGNIDMRKEPDGRVSASALYTKLGHLPFLLTVILDIGLAALSVIIANILTGSANVMMLSGIVTVAGHNWSIWLKFKGGLGATAIAGVLFVLVPLQFSYALLVAAVVLFFTHRPGLSTAVGIMATSGFVLIQKGAGILALYPFLLFTLMLLKRFQAFREIKQAG